MEFEGYDTVIFTTTRPGEVFAAFIGSLSTRWPAARFSLGWGDRPFLDRDRIAAEDLPAEAGELFAVRDREMEEHFAERSCTPMPEGEGPVAILARVRPCVVFRCERLDEVRANDRRPGEVEPYLAWLCCPSLYEVTVVTPAAPGGDPFSGWACEAVRAACLGGGK
jgi:hypothetical protein